MHTQLLCTFSGRNKYVSVIDSIISSYDIVFDKIYVFQNESDTDEFIYTYNVEIGNVGGILEKTISLHRKKHTNTLYTINAVNEIIKKENNGIPDKNFPIEWKNYRNKLLLTNAEGLHIIPTKIFKIVDINTWKIQ